MGMVGSSGLTAAATMESGAIITARDWEDWPIVTVKPTRESLFATSARERAT